MNVVYHTFVSFFPKGKETILESGQLITLNETGQVIVCDGKSRPFGICGTTNALHVSDKHAVVYNGATEAYISLNLVDTFEIPHVGELLAAGEAGTFTEPSDDFPHVIAQVIDNMKSTNNKLPSGIPGDFLADDEGTLDRFIRIHFNPLAGWSGKNR